MADVGPTVRQWEPDTRLRKLRNSLDWTVEEVGAKLLCSATKISRVETGARRPTLRDVRDLCGIYGVSEPDTWMYHFPALSQTEYYARVIIKGIAPQIDARIHEQRIEARLRRQERLDQDDRPRFRVLLDEAVLHRRVGGATVMAAQLDKVLQVERDGKATIQVIPFDVGAHASQDSNFVLLEFDEPEPLPPVAFVESLTNQLYQEILRRKRNE